MSVDWTAAERDEIARGIEDHDLRSGRCAALARIVYRLGKPNDAATRGIQLRCKGAARYLVPKKPHIPHWNAHVYVETMAHAVDAVTGPDGYAAADYVSDHWHWCDKYEAAEVDVAMVDPGIEDER